MKDMRIYSNFNSVCFQIIVFMFLLSVGVQAQISSQANITLPQNGAQTFVVESGQSLTVNSGTSITLKPGVHFKSGSNVLLKINFVAPPAPNIPNDNLDMNWTLARSFDANGVVIGETKTFFGDNGQALQTQAKDFEAQHVLAIQNLYDVGGNMVGSTMAAPINNASFSYKANFVTAEGGTIFNYRNYSRFINPSGNGDKTYAPDPVSASEIGTLGYYYSINNVWERLQDISKYPYSTSTLANNGTNILKVSGGVGEQFKLGSSHETMQFSFPAVGEYSQYLALRNRFWPESEIGSKSFVPSKNVLMSVVVDADKRSVISMSIDGRTVMTSRFGPDYPMIRSSAIYQGYSVYFPVLEEKDFPGLDGVVENCQTGEKTTYSGSQTARLGIGLYKYTSSLNRGIAFNYSVSDITYTFYDQLGRVKAIIPPEGVKKITSATFPSNASIAEVPFVQLFEYDGQGNLTANSDPDAGRSEFKYSSDGKLRYSQNALQKLSNSFSYTNYDQYGRMIETGQLQSSNATTFSALAQSTLDATGAAHTAYPIGTKSDVAVVTYDAADPITDLTGYVQDPYFLSGSAVSSKARYSGAVSAANLISKTWYNYDGNGSLIWSVKYTQDLGYKTMDYVYDDLGKVTKRIFQKNVPAETFVHYFEYDKNQRMVAAYTNTSDNAATKVLHAKYSYYLHGSLKRIELGDRLQGIDYVYSIDGKLKSINNARADRDPGNDGGTSGFAADVFGMNLEYHAGDYSNTAIGLGSIQGNSTPASFNGQVNGISWFSKKTSSQTGQDGPLMNTYLYDEVGQLLENHAGTPNFSIGSFVAAGSVNQESGLSYDSHGNIQTLKRRDAAGNLSSDFTYNYQPNTNKLLAVSNYASYAYDAIGQMTKQKKGANEMHLDYDGSGKVTKIYSNAAKSTLMLSFVYDDDGNRIVKKDHRNNMSTFYSYDANGGLVAIFDNNGSNRSIRMIEQPVYGGHQLGTYYKQASNYQYTLADHTGNTRVIVNRNKLSNGNADVVYYADYYPFGSTLRSGGIESRYGYQGRFAEKDNETGWNNFELRNYDANTGRWLTTDPYGQYHSPYVGMGNNPITGFDPDGGWSSDPPVKKSIRLPEVIVTRNRTNNSFILPPTFMPKYVPSGPIISTSVFTRALSIGTLSAVILMNSTSEGPKPEAVEFVNDYENNIQFVNAIKKHEITKNNRDKDGSYTITWKDGKKYHGKGPMSRMLKSAARITAALHNLGGDNTDISTIDKLDWSPSVSAREAFKVEYRRMQTDRIPFRYDEGYQNPINYNLIQSPGKAYSLQDGY